MADLKPQVYKDPRPAEHFTRFHERARKGIGWTYRAVRIILTVPTIVIYRCRAIGLENIPRDGPGIVTPNHFSQMDHFFAAVFMIHRRVQFMAKSQLFTNPILTYVFTHGGVFPVRRGHSDEEAFKTAHTILGRDGLVLMYAEGGRSRSGGLGEPKRGVGKLALEAGVPVVPVAIHGSAGVRGWKKFRFPKVTVQYGEPIPFERNEHPSREEQQAAADKVFAEVRLMYEALEQKGRRGVLRERRAARKVASLNAGERQTAVASESPREHAGTGRR